ncbi:MAG: ThuA domain-containing protein [Saprospiraceae bacterium]|nr:ThuA domain-containing protein [Saprospiraceae bacterium]
MKNQINLMLGPMNFKQIINLLPFFLFMAGFPPYGWNPIKWDPGKAKNVVFLVSEDVNNYEADRTIPLFAQQLEKNFNFKAHVLLGEGPRSAYEFPDLSILKEADLVVVFCRRLALPESQMASIKEYIQNGNPVLGIRTANHAFSDRTDSIEVGYVDWWGFVPEVLGCENRGYGAEELGADIRMVPDQANHPILKGIQKMNWHTIGSLYRVVPTLDTTATILLTGSVEQYEEPVAWTRETNNGGEVFYTSLGHPMDFENPDFINMVNQAITWLTRDNN